MARTQPRARDRSDFPVYPGLRSLRAEADERGIPYEKFWRMVQNGRVAAVQIEGARELFVLDNASHGIVEMRARDNTIRGDRAAAL